MAFTFFCCFLRLLLLSKWTIIQRLALTHIPKLGSIACMGMLVASNGSAFGQDCPMSHPVLYLQTPATTELVLRLKLTGKVEPALPPYPTYGWNLRIEAGGQITDLVDGKQYQTLHYHLAVRPPTWKIDSGSIVSRQEYAHFLRGNLAALGAQTHEINDFIAYWIPVLWQHRYLKIYFALEYQRKNDTHTNSNGHLLRQWGGLEANPTPEGLFRIVLLFQPVEKPYPIPRQTLPPLQRKGVSVLELNACPVPEDPYGDMTK
jgi:hypothetical protein